jgi:hypothetical protein
VTDDGDTSLHCDRVLLVGALVVDSPFTRITIIVLGATAFLLARFIRIERRLDKIEGIERSSRIKHGARRLWSNRERLAHLAIFCIIVVFFVFMIYGLWYDWPGITEDARRKGAFLISKGLNPRLYEFQEAYPVVFLSGGLILSFLVLLMVISFAMIYVLSVGTLLGHPYHSPWLTLEEMRQRLVTAFALSLPSVCSR